MITTNRLSCCWLTQSTKLAILVASRSRPLPSPCFPCSFLDDFKIREERDGITVTETIREIAMALEFIQDVMPERETTVAYGKDENGGLWSWKNRQRVYWEKYHVVSELSKAVRHSEQRQALARTRYLFHDVDFYIVSKDKVNDFDSFLPMAIDEQYLSIIFKPISIRENSLYWAVKDIVEERLKVNEPISRKDIFDNYKEKLDTNRIDTIGEHLRRLAGDGFLVKKGNSYYDPDKE